MTASPSPGPRCRRGLASPARKKGRAEGCSTPASPIEIRPNVFWLHPPDGGEVYVVRTRAGLVMLDSGMLRHRDRLLALMADARLDPRQIRLGIMTHFHADHVGGMGWWAAEFGFPVAAHAEAVGPVGTPDLTVTGACMPYIGYSDEFSPCPIATPLVGGEVLGEGDDAFEIVYAPGHSVSSIHVCRGDVLFVGDTIFGNGGIGWMDVHWGSNPEDYVETLDRLRPFLGKLIFSGHGEPFVLDEQILRRARKAAAFYIPPSHGLGLPRAVSRYRAKWNRSGSRPAG